MRLGYDLILEQSQKLVMTPELRQAIELLQFNTVELNEYLTNELEENPMLDTEEGLGEEESSLEEKTEEEVDWEEYFDNSNNYEYRQETDKNQEQTQFEAFIRYEPTMNDSLLAQLRLSIKDEKEKQIGKILIQNLDERGYFQGDLKDLSKRLNVQTKELENILKKIQKFEPLGIGARNLKECLLIQVDKEKKDYELVIKIISDYLEDVAYNRINKIAKELGVDKERVVESIEYIKTLEPRPAKHLSDLDEEVRYITPDAEIKLVDGRYKVILNDVTAPRLIINNQYRRMMKSSEDDKAVDYLKNRFNRAMWVIQSIEQRRNTIRKVLESILKFQKEFFIEGEKSLKPLTMKEVADDIDMHESTVSRVTTGKYVQTPRGLFEFKYFFSSGILGVGGDVSSTSIKVIIEEIIDEEDPKKPYSDQKLSDILNTKGIKISRRTVAKYRNELGILSSSMRRGH